MLKRILARLGIIGIALSLVYTGYSLKPIANTAGVALAAAQATILQEADGALLPVIAYQARLLDTVTGQPKPDGAYTVAFHLYNVPTGGSPLWSEIKSIPVNKGLLSTLLGDTTALNLSLFTGQALYLGITVGSDPETAPRQRLAHVVYAIRAEQAAVAATAHDAALLDGQDSTAFAPTVHSHAGDTITDASLTAADLAAGAVTNIKLAADAVMSANIRDQQVTTADLADGAITEGKLATGVVPKFLSLDPMGAFLTTGATFSSGFGPNAGIHMADGTNGSFYLGFTIPPNFTTGSTSVVRFLWHTSATNCSVDFQPNAISVARPGRTHIVGGTTGSGLTVIGGTTLFAPAASNQTNETRVTITSPDGVTPLQAGDSVIFSLFRSGTTASDTCTADFVIQSVSITYQ